MEHTRGFFVDTYMHFLHSLRCSSTLGLQFVEYNNDRRGYRFLFLFFFKSIID